MMLSYISLYHIPYHSLVVYGMVVSICECCWYDMLYDMLWYDVTHVISWYIYYIYHIISCYVILYNNIYHCFEMIQCHKCNIWHNLFQCLQFEWWHEIIFWSFEKLAIVFILMNNMFTARITNYFSKWVIEATFKLMR